VPTPNTVVGPGCAPDTNPRPRHGAFALDRNQSK
jgi:hypothetical protein